MLVVLIMVQRFHRHQTIFKEGDPIDNIYLIHKGEVQIMMDVYQPPIKNKLGIKVNQPNKSINLEEKHQQKSTRLHF